MSQGQPKKFIKPNKVVIVLAGRYAGRKAVIVRAFDEGTRERPFPHALVAGIDRYPQKVTKSMSIAKIKKRCKIKPFVKHINYNHIMPTRYSVSELEVKSIVNANTIKKLDSRIATRKELKASFEDKYINRKGSAKAGLKYFYKKLRF